jgi:hypothetical protein
VFSEEMTSKQNCSDVFLLLGISSHLGGKTLQVSSRAVCGAMAANADGHRELQALVVSDRQCGL